MEDEDYHEYFITTEEHNRLQSVYEYWLKYIKPQSLVPALFSNGLLDTRDKQSVDSQYVIERKNELLWDAVICRATYTELQRVKKILESYNLEAYQYIAKYFPNRNHRIVEIKRNEEPQGMLRQPPSYERTLQNIKDGRAIVHNRPNSGGLPQNTSNAIQAPRIAANERNPPIDRNLVSNTVPGSQSDSFTDRLQPRDHGEYNLNNNPIYRLHPQAHDRASRSELQPRQLPPAYRTNGPTRNTPPPRLDPSSHDPLSPQRSLTLNNYYIDENNHVRLVDDVITRDETAFKQCLSSSTAMPLTSASSASSGMSTGASGYSRMSTGTTRSCTSPPAHTLPLIDSDVEDFADHHEKASLSSATSHSSLAPSSASNSLERRRNPGATTTNYLTQTNALNSGYFRFNSDVRINLVSRSPNNVRGAGGVIPLTLSWVDSSASSTSTLKAHSHDYARAQSQSSFEQPPGYLNSRDNSSRHFPPRALSSDDGMVSAQQGVTYRAVSQPRVTSYSSPAHPANPASTQVGLHAQPPLQASAQSGDTASPGWVEDPYRLHPVLPVNSQARDPEAYPSDPGSSLVYHRMDANHYGNHHQYSRAYSFQGSHFQKSDRRAHSNSAEYNSPQNREILPPRMYPGPGRIPDRGHESPSNGPPTRHQSYPPPKYPARGQAEVPSDLRTYAQIQSYHESYGNDQTPVKTRLSEVSQGDDTHISSSGSPKRETKPQQGCRGDNVYVTAGSHGNGNDYPKYSTAYTQGQSEPRLRGYKIDQTPTRRISRARPQSWKSQADLRQLAPSSDEDSDDSDDAPPRHVTPSGLSKSHRAQSKSQPDLRRAGARQSRKHHRGARLLTRSCLHGRRRISSLRALACCCFRLNMLNIDVQY